VPKNPALGATLRDRRLRAIGDGQIRKRPSVFAEGRIVHKLSGSTVTIRQRGSLLEHRLERRGVAAEYPVAYSVGAGIMGYSYMVRLRRYLFQSPVSYYTQTKSWDLTGLRDGAQSRFHA
jgi:hypothetical protein